MASNHTQIESHCFLGSRLLIREVVQAAYDENGDLTAQGASLLSAFLIRFHGQEEMMNRIGAQLIESWTEDRYRHGHDAIALVDRAVGLSA